MQERSAMQRPLQECSACALNERALNAGALSVAKKVCSSTRAAEDGATTKVEWRSEVRRNEGASSSMGGGEVDSGVLRAAAHWRAGSRQ